MSLPTPDDLEYGAASAAARWTSQGKQVTYLLATRGEAGIDSVHPDEAAALREEEERSGARGIRHAELRSRTTQDWRGREPLTATGHRDSFAVWSDRHDQPGTCAV